MKKQKKPRGRGSIDDAGDLDWEPLYRALQDSIECVLDVAARLAAPYPEEVEAIENVRAFVRAKLAGRPAKIRLGDLMLTFGIIIVAIDRDVSDEAIAPFRLSACPTVVAVRDVFAIPMATELWEPTVTRHCPGAHADPTRRVPHVRFDA